MRAPASFFGLLPAVCLLACGSNKATSAATSAAGGATDVTGTPAAAQTIAPESYSSKIAQQSTEDGGQHADLSEALSSGTYDEGGTKSGRKGQNAQGFAMTQSPNEANQNSGDFRGSMTFSGAAEGSQTVHGSCGGEVRHQGGNNSQIVLNMNMTRTSNRFGDTISVVTEPNVVVSKVGTRQSGTVTRTIVGTVERTRTSVQDANRNFDLVLNHNLLVVDTYGVASEELASRKINGSTQVADKLHNVQSTVLYTDIERGKPGACLCPTAGTIHQTITNAAGATETHTYVFGGSCGESTVSVDGSAAVGATPSAGNANHAALAAGADDHTAHATGSLTWAECLPANP